MAEKSGLRKVIWMAFGALVTGQRQRTIEAVVDRGRAGPGFYTMYGSKPRPVATSLA